MNSAKQKKQWAKLFGRETTLAETSVPVPHIVPAQVLAAVYPLIPARFLTPHLRQDEIEPTFWALFTVHIDGTATAEMTESTGHAALDAVALEAARRWQFQPATQDGELVEPYLRLKIEFETTLSASRRISRKEGKQ